MDGKPETASPAEIDRHAREYLELKKKAIEAALVATKALELANEKGAILKDLVASFGSSHAEKSKIIYGLEFEAVATYGQLSSIDGAAVENFRAALQKSDRARLAGKIFEKAIRWTLRSEASEIVRGEKLTPKLAALWSKCIVLKDKAPSLNVRPRSAA